MKKSSHCGIGPCVETRDHGLQALDENPCQCPCGLCLGLLDRQVLALVAAWRHLDMLAATKASYRCSANDALKELGRFSDKRTTVVKQLVSLHNGGNP